MRILFGLVAVMAALMAYVRLAPTDVAHWHRWTIPETEVGDVTGRKSFVAIRAGGDATALAEIDRVARATPRTTVIAGAPEEGMVTYVTRSRFWGFPDYTTVRLAQVAAQTRLMLYGRARFGGGDLGVNRDRILVWLAAAGL